MSVSGPSAATTGVSYTLNLKADLTTTVSGWSINWGDGVTTTAGASATTATHTYSTAGNYTPAATTTYTGGGTTVDALGLDVNFGSGGKLVSGLLSEANVANGVAVQTNGKVIVAGRTSSTGNFTLSRYNADGTIDTTFGTSGTVTTVFAYNNAAVLSLAVTGNEAAGTLKIYAGGFWSGGYLSGGYGALGVSRYTSNGTLDTSFNSSGATPGMVATDLTNNQSAVQLAVQSSGNLLIGGASLVFSGGAWQIGSYTIERYTTAGVLDTTFATSGKLTTSYSGYFGNFTNFSSGGSIVTVGLDSGNFVVRKFSVDGTLDTTFGSSGSVNTGFFTGDDEAYLVTTDSSGRIIVGGALWNGSNVFVLKRYTSAGAADTTFGSSGLVYTTIPQSKDWTDNVVVQTDGKIVAAGTSTDGSGNFDLMRFNSNGSIDTTFGSGGTLHSDYTGGNATSGGATAAGNGVANGLYLQTVNASNYLLLGAKVNDGGGTPRFALVRFLQSSALAVNPPGPIITSAAAAADSPVTGTSTLLSVAANESGATLTYTWSILSKPAGALDPTFSDNADSTATSVLTQFSNAGAYSFRVTVSDGTYSRTSDVSVTASATLSQLDLSPQPAYVSASATRQFTASAHDQFGNVMSVPSDLTWSRSYTGSVNPGTISVTSGLFSATSNSSQTSCTITASSASTGFTQNTTLIVAPNGGPVEDLQFNALSGTTVSDVSGYGNNGTLVGSPTPNGATDGATGLYFNGAGQYVSVPDNSSLDPTSGITVAAWINADSWTNGQVILQKSTLGNNNQYRLYDDAGVLEFRIDGVSYAYTTLPSTHAWHSVIATYTSASGMNLYVDGTLAGTGSGGTSMVVSSGPLVIGDKPGSTSNSDSFHGTIAEAKVFNYVVSPPYAAFASPSVATAAAAGSTTVTGTSTTLSVLGGTSVGPESALTYTWVATNQPPGAPDPFFSDNGANSSKATTATFFQAGTYTLECLISDGVLTKSSSVTVTVAPTLSSIMVFPGSSTLANGGTFQLSTFAEDQFGNAFAPQPPITWAVTGGSANGTVSSIGLYTAPSSGSGPFTVTATATVSGATVSGSAQFTIGASSAATNPPPAVQGAIATADDGTGAQIGWNDGSGVYAPTGFLIEASSDGGSTFNPIGTAGATDTSFQATNLIANASYLFSVTPFDAAGLSSFPTVSSAVTVGAQSVAGWYKVSFNDPSNPSATTEAFLQGDSTNTPGGSLTIATGGWVQADSQADAVRKALSGSFVSGAGGASYSYSHSGAMRFNPDLVLANGTDVGPAIVAEESYSCCGHGDADYNDAYVALNVTANQLSVQATTPSAGSTAVGSFFGATLGASASDYAATVTWTDGTTSPGRVTESGGGFYSLNVDSSPTSSQAANFTINVALNGTSISAYANSMTGPGRIAAPASHHAVYQAATIEAVTLVRGSDQPVIDPLALAAASVYTSINSANASQESNPPPQLLGDVPDAQTITWKYNQNAVPQGFKIQYAFGSPALPSSIIWTTVQGMADVHVLPDRYGNYRLPASIPDTSLIDLNGRPFTSFSGGNHDFSDPDVCYFRITPVGTTNPAVSAAVCAPQIYFMWGGNGTLNGNGQLFANLFDNSFGAEVHAFTWANTVAASTAYGSAFTNPVYQGGAIDQLKNDILAAKFPSVLFGQSFGGAQAVNVATDLDTANSPHAIKYLGLFDPVANDQNGSGSGVTQSSKGTLYESEFTVPANVFRGLGGGANDWWQTVYGENNPLPADLLDTADPGPILNTNRRQNIFSVGNLGTYHTSQNQNVQILKTYVLPEIEAQTTSPTQSLFGLGPASPWIG